MTRVIFSASGYCSLMCLRKCAQSILVLRSVTRVKRLPASGGYSAEFGR